MSKPGKPDLVVYGRSRASVDHWKRIGSGWSNKTRGGVPHVRIALDFLPNDYELSIWPAGSKPGDDEAEAES